MFNVRRPMFLYTEGSVHPGAGSSPGVVDLPIQREVHTGLPIIQGSELKGALREHMETLLGEENADVKRVFGTAAEADGAGWGGALGFSMAQVLLFPVASLRGVFAWATCPLCLSRLRFDLRSAGLSDRFPTAIPDVPDDKTVLVPTGAGDLIMEGKVFLSEFPFEAKESKELAAAAEYLSGRLPAGHDYFRDKLYSAKGKTVHSNLVLVHDDVFRDLLKIRTEVVHRNVIDKKSGTTDNLWTEENLPGDVLMYSLIYAADPYQPNGTLRTAGDVAGFLESNNLAAFILGGSQTVGRGWISATFDKPEAAGAKGEPNAAKPKK